MSKQVVYLMNGIGDSYHDTMKNLEAPLLHAGITPYRIKYPVVTRYTAWQVENLVAARIVVEKVPRGADIIAHSWAANPILEALRDGHRFGRIILFSPACPEDVDFDGLLFDKIYCVHNPKDIAIWVGKWSPFGTYGNAGRQGFDAESTDPRVDNVKAKSWKGWWNHSFYFRGDLLRWQNFCIDKLKEHRGCNH